MNSNIKFNLSNRLMLCAEMIDSGCTVADIGTDHGYIPIYLALSGKTHHALACDVAQGPLKNAIENIKHYGLESIIEARISDGLKQIKETEADQVIIAGMGGNLISNILNECSWNNKSHKTFILQPMKYEDKLHIFLSQNGYIIETENAVVCNNKAYVTIKAKYSGQTYSLQNHEIYIGKLEQNLDENAIAYINKQIKNLQNHLQGATSHQDINKMNYYSSIIQTLGKIKNNYYERSIT